jgi:CBS domain-containing protein
MQVREAMARTIGVASPRDPMKKIAQLMKREDAGFIPICEGNSVLGVITDRDIVVRCMADGHEDILNEPAEHCMTRNPATIESTASLEDAAELMERLEVRRLPVVDDGRLVGILSHGNLVQATHSEGAGDTATLGVTRGA